MPQIPYVSTETKYLKGTKYCPKSDKLNEQLTTTLFPNFKNTATGDLDEIIRTSKYNYFSSK